MVRRLRHKGLRARVAERANGAAPRPPARWRHWLRLTGMGLQIVSFVLLLLEAFQFLDRGFRDLQTGLVTAYLVIFFAGRLMQVIASFRPR
ncbi:MAG: hypothetical protein ACE5ED_05965 [Rhodothalassiaceae bacterium]